VNLGAYEPIERKQPSTTYAAPPTHSHGRGSCSTCGLNGKHGHFLPVCAGCHQRSLHRVFSAPGQELVCEYGCDQHAGLMSAWRAEMHAAIAGVA
jgi:hypothetical protein